MELCFHIGIKFNNEMNRLDFVNSNSGSNKIKDVSPILSVHLIDCTDTEWLRSPCQT